MSTRLSRSLIGLCLVSALAAGCFTASPSRQHPQAAAGTWQVEAVNWSVTDGAGEGSESFPIRGSTLKTGQRIETASGQDLELYVGKIRIGLRPNTAVIVGDDDPGTEIGTFELVSGRISLTLYKGAFATIDAPRLKAASHGADFSMSASDKATKVSVLDGQVTVLSNGTTAELGADQVATVRGEQEFILVSGNAAWLAEAKARRPWVLKEIHLDKADPSLDPGTLPKPGAFLAVGAQVSTMLGSEIWIERDSAAGHDIVKIRPGSLVTIGDSDPATERQDLSILKGSIEVEASSSSISVYAPHLLATINNAKCVVGAAGTISSVSAEDGTCGVSSLLTGVKKDVPVGVTQVVRSKQTPPLSFPPEMGVEQMQ
jgi:hypothetical protein